MTAEHHVGRHRPRPVLEEEACSSAAPITYSISCFSRSWRSELTLTVELTGRPSLLSIAVWLLAILALAAIFWGL
jgi:hypothetical protein